MCSNKNKSTPSSKTAAAGKRSTCCTHTLTYYHPDQWALTISIIIICTAPFYVFSARHFWRKWRKTQVNCHMKKTNKKQQQFYNITVLAQCSRSLIAISMTWQMFINLMNINIQSVFLINWTILFGNSYFGDHSWSTNYIYNLQKNAKAIFVKSIIILHVVLSR